ncbi:MAG: ornithine carbamoyltransferase [Burkholderiaceae bacterium]|nr:ornithine carbamoyltransferase [Burkholderiaceae bacterium]
MSPPELKTLQAHARQLLLAAQDGGLQPLLRGKKLGLLCAREDSEYAQLFRRAAEALGGHVARLPVSLSATSSTQDVQHTARLLGRLYDAIECQDMDSALVARVREAADVPVFDTLAAAAPHWIDESDDPGSPADRRLSLLQALLLTELA